MSEGRGQISVDVSNKGAALLKRLQGEDEQISRLLCHASHTALYKYNPPQKSWERLGVEGPLVIVQRMSAPYTQMVILNRQSRDNYVIDISTIIRTKTQDPYLMLQLMRGAGSKLVLGCWFYGSDEREQVRRVLEAVIEEGDKGARGAAPVAAASTAPAAGGDRASGQQILQLLRKDNSAQRKPSPINTNNSIGHGTEAKRKTGKATAAPASPIQASPQDLLTPSQVLGVPSKFADRAAATAALLR